MGNCQKAEAVQPVQDTHDKLPDYYDKWYHGEGKTNKMSINYTNVKYDIALGEYGVRYCPCGMYSKSWFRGPRLTHHGLRGPGT